MVSYFFHCCVKKHRIIIFLENGILFLYSKAFNINRVILTMLAIGQNKKSTKKLGLFNKDFTVLGFFCFLLDGNSCLVQL